MKVKAQNAEVKVKVKAPEHDLRGCKKGKCGVGETIKICEKYVLLTYPLLRSCVTQTFRDGTPELSAAAFFFPFDFFTEAFVLCC